MKRVLLASLLGLLFLIGCQLIVPSDLPAVKCGSTDPSACPSGLTCDLGTGTCVSPSNIEPDADLGDGDVDLDGDTGTTDGPPGLANLGSPCATDNDCKSKLCGKDNMLTALIVPAGTPSICTQTCCTSASCPAGFVCFAGGEQGTTTGTAYCVPANRAKRTPPSSGGKSPGIFCSKASDCRSGLCEDSRCVDTCCLSADCAAGTTCRIYAAYTPPQPDPPKSFIWACAAPNTFGDGGVAKPPNSSCVVTTDCANDNCSGFPSKKCRPSCCGADDCTNQGLPGTICSFGQAGTDTLRWCIDPWSSGSPTGTSCQNDSDCRSLFCDPQLGKCLEACCGDGDCSSGETCKLASTGAPFWRCVPR
jgi:hypothetical protein